jgi:hypothetical protein
MSRLLQESSNIQFEPYTSTKVRVCKWLDKYQNEIQPITVIVDLHKYKTSLPKNSPYIAIS